MTKLFAQIFILCILGCVQAKTRSYNLTISIAWSSTDGHGRPAFMMNGQTPGPLIEADEGDEIEVFLDNQLAFETTMHWFVDTSHCSLGAVDAMFSFLG